MRSSYSRWQLLLVATLGLILALGCAQAQKPGPSVGVQQGEVVTAPDQIGPVAPIRGGIWYDQGRDPIGWDPIATTASYTNQNVNLVLEGLTQLITWEGDQPAKTDDMRVAPLLAESWEAKSDTEYIFKLRKGVKFKDNGETLKRTPEGVVKDREMTAHDIVWSWNLAKDPLTGSRETKWKAGPIKEFQALDDYTVRVVLKEPYAPFLVYLSGNPFWAFAKESFEKFGNYKRAEAAIGTGPWILAEYKPNVVVRFKRNPDYWQKGLPYLDELNKPIKLAESVLATFRVGKLDHYQPVWGDVETLRKTNPDLQWIRVGELPCCPGTWISMRSDQKPFDDVRVRRAVGMAMDWEGMMQAECGRFAHLGCKAYRTSAVGVAFEDSYLPYEEWPQVAKESWTYNPKRAKELLAEAGYPNGFDTLMNVGGQDYYGASRVESWDIMKKWLEDVGIRATIKSKLYTAFITSTFQGDYEGMTGPQSHHGYSEPNDYSYYLFFPGLAGNRSHVDDPDMNKALIAQQREMDPAKRGQLLREVARINVEKAYQYHWPNYTSVGRAQQPWAFGYVPKGGGCWGLFGNQYLRAYIDPSKKPMAALTMTAEGAKVAAADPQALVKRNPVGKSVSCAGSSLGG